GAHVLSRARGLARCGQPDFRREGRVHHQGAGRPVSSTCVAPEAGHDASMASSSITLDGANVVLSGASGGLGGAIAHALNEKGAHPVLSGRRADRLEALARDLRDAEVEPCDFADREAGAGFAERVEDADALVPNAALPGAG